MATSVKHVAKYLLFLGFGAGLLYLAFRNTNLHQMLLDLKNANYYWVGVSLAVSFLAYVIRAHRWNMLIKPLGYAPKLKNTLASLMVGYLANLAVPRIGEISRAEALARAEKIPFNLLIGTVISERVVDLIMLCLVLLLTAILKMKVLGNFILQKIIYPFKNTMYSSLHNINFILIALSVILCFTLLLIFLWKKQNAKAAKSLKKLLIGIKEGVVSIKNVESKFWFVFHTFLIWIIYFLTSYICFFAIPATTGLGIVAGIFTVAIGGIGMSAPVQGGIGTYHLMISIGLTLFGITLKDGNTYATIVHTSQTLLVLIAGAVSILFLFLANRNPANDISSNNTK
jgi:uncharacterized protein (TIRG00374 family)